MTKRQLQITLRLTPEEHEALKAAAEAEHRSLSNYIRLAIRLAVLDKACAHKEFE